MFSVPGRSAFTAAIGVCVGSLTAPEGAGPEAGRVVGAAAPGSDGALMHACSKNCVAPKAVSAAAVLCRKKARRLRVNTARWPATVLGLIMDVDFPVRMLRCSRSRVNHALANC